jgi:mannose-1-phosphate guanylyltransferase/mannose-1-phosphate guanylyltransferase/mannose-6-phosphate isomerase
VILSGGSGTRLWPLSTQARPKQFARIVPEGPTLFEATLTRLSPLEDVEAPIVVTGTGHLALVTEAAEASGISPWLTIVEPVGRNTAPAAAAAALASDPSEILVLLPSDHLIDEVDRFGQHVAAAAALARTGSIVTFGVTPDRPETGYGYIEVGDPLDGGYTVTRFKEKPTAEAAAEMAIDGRHLWNSGMFVATAGTLTAELDRLAPTVLSGVAAAMTPTEDGLLTLGPSFSEVEAISFDHAVMERTGRAAVIPIDVGWDDIGSFQAVWARAAKDADGNYVSGDVLLDEVSGSLVMATSRTLAVAGLSDMVVIETPEAVLVLPLDRAQEVRGLAERARP